MSLDGVQREYLQVMLGIGLSENGAGPSSSGRFDQSFGKCRARMQRLLLASCESLAGCGWAGDAVAVVRNIEVQHFDSGGNG